jgi:protein involved in polysaccharide export with SLBB domain
LDAINVAGGLDDLVKTIYVLREVQDGESLGESLAKRQPRQADRDQALAGIVNPADPLTPLGQSDADQPSRDPTVAVESDGRDLLDEALMPEELATAPADESGPPATRPATTDTGELPALPPFAFGSDSIDTDEPRTEDGVDGEQEPVDWEELAVEGQQRIIQIPADRLRSFDSSYNIVIRHGDQIRVDPGPVGFYYMSGHVMRPGSYSLTGQEMTLTQAVAAAGGLDQLAWPTRCEVRRRIDGDREEITQWDYARIVEGKDPNFFIKPNDEVNIGTHAIAPLLATIRNSFRLTYGFGFVYDRNFADIDSYFGQQNPAGRRRNEVNQRFPGLVP